MGATWKSVNHENLACAYKWDFDFGYEQVAKADCEYPIHKLFLYDIYPANNYDTEEL